MFLKAMADGHEDAINMLRGTEQQLPESPLRKLVTKILPNLQQHHDLAVDLQSGK